MGPSQPRARPAGAAGCGPGVRGRPGWGRPGRAVAPAQGAHLGDRVQRRRASRCDGYVFIRGRCSFPTGSSPRSPDLLCSFLCLAFLKHGKPPSLAVHVSLTLMFSPHFPSIPFCAGSRPGPRPSPPGCLSSMPGPAQARPLAEARGHGTGESPACRRDRRECPFPSVPGSGAPRSSQGSQPRPLPPRAGPRSPRSCPQSCC